MGVGGGGWGLGEGEGRGVVAVNQAFLKSVEWISQQINKDSPVGNLQELWRMGKD